MGILQGSGPLGSGPTGPGSGFPLCHFILTLLYSSAVFEVTTYFAFSQP